MDSIDENRLNIIMPFFSGTGNTEKIANIMKQKLTELNVNIETYNITSYDTRLESIDIDKYDGVIFGFPIYSMRAPRVCRQWIEKLDGRGKKCFVFFTYGGFGKQPAHYYIKKLLNEHDFKLLGTAEFLGAHTFNYAGWQAVESRPNQSDYKVAEEFCDIIYNKLMSNNECEVNQFDKPMFSEEQLDGFEKYRFKAVSQLPSREGESCSMCGLCEELCPTKAMDSVNGIADKDKCILCLRCIANCPEQVLRINDLSKTWNVKLQMHNTTKEEIDILESRIFV